MNILVWGINFSPEQKGIAPYNTAWCEYLVQKGHQVTMLTSFPYYPAWQKIPGDMGKWYRYEVFEGIAVHRCWHYVPKKPSTLKRILHEGSFVVTTFLRAMRLPRPDVIMVISPPLLLGAAAWLLTCFKRAPFIFHVQDLQPDAAVGLGMMRRSWLVRALYALEKFAYQKATAISAISDGILAAIGEKGIEGSKLIAFPNGVSIPTKLPAPGEFRRRYGYHTDDFLVVYSGNLGVKQGLNILIAAARQLKQRQIQIIICGDGAQKQELAKAIAASALENVRLLPLQPELHYLEMLIDANLNVITQQSGASGCFFPSKLLKSLALGRPVLTVCDPASELGRFVEEAGCGVSVSPEAPDLLAQQLEELQQSPVLLQQYARAAKVAAGTFDQADIHQQFERRLISIVKTWKQ